MLIGITGGIGSGKSLVCHIFNTLGIAVFDADKAAREIMDHEPEVKKTLTGYFGTAVYTVEGRLNRKLLASIIFSNREAMKKVNQLVHPLVHMAFNNWTTRQKEVYVLHEAAILYESGFHSLMNLNILITAPEELRIRRTMTRDNISREQVLARMRNQWSDEEKSRLADFILINDEEHPLLEQILETDKKIRAYGEIR